MDVLTSETCWALNNEIIKQVISSWSLFNYEDDAQSNKHKIQKCVFSGNMERKESLQITQVGLPDHPSGSLKANPSTWHNINTTNLLETDWTFPLPRTTVVPFALTLPYHVWTSLNHIALGWNHRPGSKILYHKHEEQYRTSPECNKTFSIITEHR